MFRQSTRGTAVWLVIVGLALTLVLLAGGLSTIVVAGLLAAYLALITMLAANIDWRGLVANLPAAAGREQQVSEVAREAMARARTMPTYDALIQLLDVGLIVDEPRPDGVSLRRGRFVSLDDDGIRPFAIVSVPDGLAGRLGHVRFELRDESGQLQYVYEEEKWLQAGENVLLPDYRLPIRKKKSELVPGGWTAHILVDGGLLGVHHFNLAPSLAARRPHMATDGEVLRERVWRNPEEDESLPLSLEELLRQQSRQRSHQ